MILRAKLAKQWTGRNGRPSLEDGQEEPMPYQGSYSEVLEIWEMTFWELCRRRSGAMVNGIFGLIENDLLHDPARADVAEKAIFDMVPPGSAVDLDLYQRCVRRAYLYGLYKRELRKGNVTHRRVRNIFTSAGFVYPVALDKVVKEEVM